MPRNFENMINAGFAIAGPAEAGLVEHPDYIGEACPDEPLGESGVDSS